MQIVIDIPDDKWKSYQPYKGLPYDNIMDNSVRYIANGTPLPRGHGRIIDENKIEVCEWVDVLEEGYPKASTDAPTIIEADKEASE